MIRKITLFAALLCVLGCGGSNQEDAVKNTSVYQSPTGDLSLKAPAAWRVLERQGGKHRVTFFGPAKGPLAFSASIAIYRYDASAPGYVDAKEFAQVRAQGALVSEETDGLKKVFTYSTEGPSLIGKPVTVVEDSTVISLPEGFFVVTHAGPAEAVEATKNVLDSVLSSLEAPKK
ncbi:MAG: hypothetical protein COB53_03705 [Elusimicrobia bacterium]|nr:MAG: hypothetical protein COB53_03705 [Elusimicrobiota bacterium]